jgi:integrase
MTARPHLAADPTAMPRPSARFCLDAAGSPVTSKSASAHQAEGVAKRRAAIAPRLRDGARITLADVIADLQPGWMRQKDWENKKRAAREIIQFFGPGFPVATFNQDHCQRYRAFCAAQTLKVWTGGPGFDRADEDAAAFWKDTGKTRSPATVNRRLAILRLILGRAHTMRDPVSQDEVLPRVPSFEDLQEPRRRARPTPEPVLERLMAILPQHTVDAMVITLYFGFRRGEAFGLQEGNVDWHAGGVRLWAETVKDAEDAFLPGSQEAMGYLRCLAMEAQERGVRTLISYRRQAKDPAKAGPWQPIANSRRAWGTAMGRIEMEFGRRWRWHDLRAAFITHVAMMAGPMAAQKLARHADFDTTQGYIEVADEVRRRGADMAGDRPSLKLVK